MNITILDDYLDFVRHLASFRKIANHNIKIFNDHTEDIQVMAERLKDTEALVLIRERTPIGAPLIERLRKLRIISQHGPVPNIDVEACTRRGVIVCSGHKNQPSYATAELTWCLLIAAMRKLPQQIASLKAGRWQSDLGTAIRGKTLGVYGYGRLGSVVATYGKTFGMKVLVWAREASLERARLDGYDTATSKRSFFEESDVITLHMRLVAETRGIVTSDDLANMKKTALLINTSRAGLIAHGVLEAALKNGRPGMAAVDVFEDEPMLDVHHPLLSMDNVICTPHIGYAERDHFESMFSTIFDQILAYASGKPFNVKNPLALKSAKSS